LWFSNGSDFIERITTAGVVTSYAGASPQAMTAGPDGNLWFTGGALINLMGRVWDAQAQTGYVLDLASGFVPLTRGLAQGDAAQWSFYGPTSASATDSSGMGLFDSGLRSAGSSYSFTFTAAGRYPYQDSLDPAHTGSVSVPILASPASGTGATVFTITWGSTAPPGGYASSVRVAYCAALPCTPSYHAWRTGVTTTSATFSSTDPAWQGPGTYFFQGLMVNTTNHAHSGYSPTATITVS
jgi:plastocyanin